MGLRQKQRHLHFGFWEYCAVALMALTLCSAVVWWVTRPTAAWAVVPGRVIGASLVENTDPISAARPAIRIHYRFVVQGRVFQGSTPLDPLARLRYRALPGEVQTLLSRKGYHSFNDLPPEVREILRQRGINRIDAVPAPLLDTLRAQGFNSVQDFPDDVREMVRAGQYEQAADAMDAAYAERMNDLAHRESPPEVPSVAELTEGGVVYVRYDPEDPQNHYIVRLPVVEGAGGIVLLLTASALLVAYCGFVYPRVKGH
ncbi:MAG: hypothetical protein JNK74_12815 [Candidatus Hydrogenedentes bacterium]|nr:hypothetical protein [Candidatus Hydrogenedentota bacterium]